MTQHQQQQQQQWLPDEDARSYALAAQSVFPAGNISLPPDPAEDAQNEDWARRSWRSPGRTESTNSLNYAAEAFGNGGNGVAQPFNPFAQVTLFGTSGNGPMYTAKSASTANSPTARARAQHAAQAINRQSSSSSTRTEASTSSEESDLCIPSIEWVNYEQRDRHQPFYGHAQNKMPPPPEPRTPYLAVGASASTPLGIAQNASLPQSAHGAGGHANIPESALDMDEDDDAATVGQGRESPSTSSQSAQSGLDLLWKAVAHHESVPSPVQQHAQHPPAQAPAALPSDRARGKRKAGQEVVAQWRSGGYGGAGSNNMTAVSALRGGSPDTADPSGASSPPVTGGPKKRRRSQLDAFDPALAPPESPSEPDATHESAAVSEYSLSEATDDDDDNSEYHGGSSKGRRAPARGSKRAGTGAKPKAAAPKKARKATQAAGAKGRKVSIGEGSEAAQGSAQGVQCNYVFPRAVSGGRVFERS